MEPIISIADVRDAEGILKLQYLCCQSEAEIHDDYAIPPTARATSGASSCILVFEGAASERG